MLPQNADYRHGFTERQTHKQKAYPDGVGPGAQRTLARAMARNLVKGKLLKHPKTGVLYYDRPKPTRAEIEASRPVVRAGYFAKPVPGNLSGEPARRSLNTRRVTGFKFAA